MVLMKEKGLFVEYMLNILQYHNIIYVSLHGKDRSHHVQRGNKDPQLSDKPSQQQCPRRLPICLTMTKHLKKKKKKNSNSSHKAMQMSSCFILFYIQTIL